MEIDPGTFEIIGITINNKKNSDLLDNYDWLVATVNTFLFFNLTLDRFTYYLHF